MSDSKEITKLKEDFQFTLSKVSHEIRNPVTLINSFLQLMAREHPEIQDYQYWDDVQENMEFLKALLEELSAYNNAMHIQPETVDLWEFTQQIAASLKPTFTYLGHKITLEKEGSIPPLFIDKVKLRQAILNIARNASESMEGTGTVSFHLTVENSHVLLTISDTGSGIPGEYLPNLFDPFVTHKKEGTGLGLAIAKQVLEAHGGTILVSTSVNQGTAFTLALPVS